MLNIRATTLASIYGALVRNVYEDGQEVKPRGKPCSEIIPVCLGFASPEFPVLDSRAVNYKFATAELMGYICGWDDVSWLARFNKNVAQFSDDGEKFHGAYGPRMEQQLEDVVQLLTHDPESRQAIVQIWHPRDLTRITKDKPCHTELQLYVRRGALHMIVHQRSMDVVWGLPYDHFSFCVLQMVLAQLLGVMAGSQFRVIGSLHVYKPEAGYYPMTRIAQAIETSTEAHAASWWKPEFDSLEGLRHDLENVRKWLECDTTGTEQPHHECPLSGWQLQLARWLEGTA